MTIYILLILYILLLPIIGSYIFVDTRQRDRFVLRFGMLAIFLLLALKKETVGIDIVGYKQQYLVSAIVPWSDTSFVYFEPGYIQLMKVFSKLGLDFQVFAAAIYAVCCSAYYFFILRYSKNTTLSLLFFVCYQFLVFYISGLRQALAMSVCIYAFMLADGQRLKRWKSLVGAVLLVTLATSFHQSALIFFTVIVLTQWKPDQVHWVAMLLIFMTSVFIRPVLLLLINSLIAEVNLNSDIILGGNFVFLMGMALFSILGYYQKVQSRDKNDSSFLPVAANVLMMAIISNVLFSGSPLLRSSMYLSLFIIPGVPCALKCFDSRIECLLTWFLGLFLIALFWTDTLSINQLNLCPYLFFWQ